LFTAASPPAPQCDVLGLALDAIDPDELSPRAAMEALYRLKKLRAGER
jgi:DNA mismatch repair protein MutS